jgi:hypothetical protein
MRRYAQEAGPFEGNAANGLLYQQTNWSSGLRTTRWGGSNPSGRATYKDMSSQGSTGVPRRQTFVRSTVDAGSTMPRPVPCPGGTVSHWTRQPLLVARGVQIPVVRPHTTSPRRNDTWYR